MSRVRELDWQAVVARRMRRQGLIEPASGAEGGAASGVGGAVSGVGGAVSGVGGAAGGVADVVRAMCGAHAQVLSAGEVSVALRVDAATRADVQRAVGEDRTLVKTFGPRGTVHLLPAADLPLWTGALSALPRVGSLPPESMRLTADQTAEVIAAIGAALAEDDLTVDELSEQVIARTGSWAGELVMPAFQDYWPRWRQVIPAAANAGVLCYGPNRGRKVTYANPHRWTPFEPLDGEKALAELLRHYLHSYGPATPQQFAKWLSTPVPFISALFESQAGELEEVSLDGSPAWLLAGDTELPQERATGVRLLPYFDAYAVASYPRELLFPGEAWTRCLARGQAGNFPVLLVDGAVAGVWHQRGSGRKLQVTVEPLRKLTATQLRSLDEQVDRLGEIVDARPDLTIGEITVGPHA